MNQEDRIRRRAYEIWERENRPEGRHEEHWHRAADEIRAEDAAAPAVAPGVAGGARGEGTPLAQPRTRSRASGTLKAGERTEAIPAKPRRRSPGSGPGRQAGEGAG